VNRKAKKGDNLALFIGIFQIYKIFKNILTKQLKNDIIYIGGENMSEDEYGHKGIDRTVQVDKTIIESNDFRRKFDNATDNRVVNKTLYTSAKEIFTIVRGHYTRV
jgi:hypothetical protein